MSGEYGPFDRIIELSVLALIAFEVVIVPIYRKRVVGRKSKAILAFLAAGESLQDVIPGGNASNDEVNIWINKVEKWVLDVRSFLQKNAKQALVVFNRHALGPRYSLRVPPLANDWAHELNARMAVLQSIMEKPDVYF
jgi:hypothetical protein